MGDLYTQHTHRVRVDMRLPKTLLDAIDRFCSERSMTRTYFFETLARAHLKRTGNLTVKREVVTTWNSIEEMPLKPEVRQRELYS